MPKILYRYSDYELPQQPSKALEDEGWWIGVAGLGLLLKYTPAVITPTPPFVANWSDSEFPQQPSNALEDEGWWPGVVNLGTLLKYVPVVTRPISQFAVIDTDYSPNFIGPEESEYIPPLPGQLLTIVTPFFELIDQDYAPNFIGPEESEFLPPVPSAWVVATVQPPVVDPDYSPNFIAPEETEYIPGVAAPWTWPQQSWIEDDFVVQVVIPLGLDEDYWWTAPQYCNLSVYTNPVVIELDDVPVLVAPLPINQVNVGGDSGGATSGFVDRRKKKKKGRVYHRPAVPVEYADQKQTDVQLAVKAAAQHIEKEGFKEVGEDDSPALKKATQDLNPKKESAMKSFERRFTKK